MQRQHSEQASADLGGMQLNQQILQLKTIPHVLDSRHKQTTHVRYTTIMHTHVRVPLAHLVDTFYLSRRCRVSRTLNCEVAGPASESIIMSENILNGLCVSVIIEVINNNISHIYFYFNCRREKNLNLLSSILKSDLKLNNYAGLLYYLIIYFTQ